MTALRVGTDLQAIDDVSMAIRHFGERYLARIFTTAERRDADGISQADDASLTARFAAKEALLKVLRPVDTIPPWTDIEVVRMPGGWTDLHLRGRALALAEEAGLTQFAVSLSHGAGFGMATVIASGSSA